MANQSSSAAFPLPTIFKWFVPFLGLLLLLTAHGAALVYRVQPSVSLWFPPSGVAIALTLWLGPLGAVLTGLASILMAPFWGMDGWMRLAGLVDMIEPLVAWMLYRCWFRGSLALNGVRSVIAFLLSAPLFACMTSAVVSCSMLFALGKISEAAFWGVMGQWWVGNAIGTMAIAPPALLFVTPLLHDWRWIRLSNHDELPDPKRYANISYSWLEIVPILASVVVVALLTVQASKESIFAALQFSLLSTIPLIWAACRLGVKGRVVTASCNVLITLLTYLVFYPGAIAQPTFPISPELLHLHKLSLLLQCAIGLLVGTAITEWAATQIDLAVEQVRLREYQASAQLSEKLFQLNRLLTEANQQLQASEERFRTSVENMLDCFAVCSAVRDDSGRITDFQVDYVNDAACLNNQMSREAQIGGSLCKLFPTYLMNGLFEAYCRVVETGEPFVKDELIYDPSLTLQTLVKAFDMRAAKFGDGCVITWRDVTTRLQAQQELFRREQEFKALVENSPDAIARMDRNLRYLYVNPAVERTMGMSIQGFVGKTFAELGFPEEAHQRWQANLQKTIDSGKSQQDTFEFPDAEGHIHFYDAQLVPEFAPDGSVESVLVVTRDVTSLKRTERALLNANERFQLAAAAVDSMIYDWQVDSDRVERTEGLTRLLGYQLDEVEPTNRWWQRQIHPDDFTKLPTSTLSTSTLDDRYSLEYRIRHKQGHYVYVRDQGLILRDAVGNPVRVVGNTIDISEQKQAEEALRESEERLRLALIAANQGLYDLNLQTGMAIVSPEYARMLGYAPETFQETNAKWRDRLHPDDQAVVYQIYEEYVTGKRDEYRVDFRQRTQSGEWKWILSVGKIVKWDEHGNPLRMLGTHTDITERKHAEEALRLSNARSRRLVDSNLIGVAFSDAEGYVLDANEAFLRIVGYTQPEMHRINWRQLTPPEYHSLDDQANADVFTTGTCVPFEKEYIRKDGTRVPVLVGVAALQEQEHGTLCFVIDLSERKQNEEALRRSQERLNLALEAAGMGIWNWDLQTGEVRSSAQFNHLFGIPIDIQHLSLETFIDLLHRDDRELVQRAIQQAIYTHEEFNLEFRVRRTDGTVRWLASKGRAFYNSIGNPIQMTGVSLDITERKSIEAERENILVREQAARQQAESASRMKDEFLAIVSHELRSPLNGILGWSRLLRTRTMTAQKQQQALASIERNAQAQAQLIEDLLDISRIIRGKIRLYPRPIHLVPVLQAAIDTIRPSADAKAISLETQFDFSIRQVSGDPDRLQQIVWNLLSNAIKFTPNGGRVTLKLEQVIGEQSSVMAEALEQSTVPAAARITVIDTGKGISAEFLPYVFDRFRQADSSTTRSEGGLGLGLAIVRNLVELHGGSVYVDSAGLGQGARFTVELPLLPDNRAIVDNDFQQPDDGDSAAESLVGLRILVVDDEVDTREFLVAALEQFGATAIAAASTQEAIALLQQTHPDVLLSDIGMPEEDGYNLIQKVRELPPQAGGNIPAAAITAYVQGDDQQRAIAAGFQLHISKPIDPAQLLTIVQQLMQQRQENEGQNWR
ncbi:MAG: PAS domain S-box protein [Oscillatoriales cyanobacterium C42_A2020_001]|nr:PAS domain S-box protein [Leptolyngbyaceae cyanobacterium C42_A2020_001]